MRDQRRDRTLDMRLQLARNLRIGLSWSILSGVKSAARNEPQVSPSCFQGVKGLRLVWVARANSADNRTVVEARDVASALRLLVLERAEGLRLIGRAVVGGVLRHCYVFLFGCLLGCGESGLGGLDSRAKVSDAVAGIPVGRLAHVANSDQKRGNGAAKYGDGFFGCAVLHIRIRLGEQASRVAGLVTLRHEPEGRKD